MQIDIYFKSWPFSVIPDRTERLVWAGRPELRKQLFFLLQSFEYRPQSTLDLVWAAFGSGKTHLLYYLEQEAKTYNQILPWYCIVPQNAQSFSNLYRCLMFSFPKDAITSDLLRSLDTRSGEFEIGSILQALIMGSQEQKDTASDWIRGLRVDMRVARKLLYLPYKLETTYQMQRVFIQILKAFAYSGVRPLLLLDEYQRVLSRQACREGLNYALLDAFNSIPKGLSVVFSCSAAQQASAIRVFSTELADRMRGRRILCLPVFSGEEALEFVLDLMKQHRPKGYKENHYAPFSQELLSETINRVASADNLMLIPRHIIQVLDCALGLAVSEGTRTVTQQHLAEAVKTVSTDNTANVTS